MVIWGSDGEIVTVIVIEGHSDSVIEGQSDRGAE